MPDFAVSTAFTARDKVSGAFKKMGRGADVFGNKADRAFRKASRGARGFGSVTKGVLAAGVVQNALGRLTQGLAEVTGQFVAFDDAIVGATVRFKDIGPDAKDFAKQLDILKAAARDAGATTQFTAAQAATALDFLARAGFNSVEAMGSLRSMIDLATASGEDFALVADYSSDLLGAFGLNAQDSAQKIKNLARLNDVLVSAVNSSNVTVESLFETMKQAGPVAGIVGASLEEVTALAAALGSAGIKGTEGATALKNAMLRLAAPTKKAKGLLAEIGVSTEDADKNLRKVTSILADMGKAMKGMGTAEQAKILDEIFGKRAIAGAKNIMDSLSQVADFEKQFNNASTTAKRSAEVMRQSLGNKLRALVSALTEKVFELFSTFAKGGKEGIDVVVEAIRKFDMRPIIEGLKTTINLVNKLYKAVEPFLRIMPEFLGYWIAYQGVIKGIALVQFAQGMWALTAAIYASSGAMGVLNAVMLANPIGLIAGAIGLVAAQFVYLYRQTGSIQNAFIKLGEIILNAILWPIRLIIGAFGQLLSFIPGMGDISAAITKYAEGIKFDLLPQRGEEPDGSASARGSATAPNQATAEARSQGINFQGNLDITGAPEGSSVTSQTTGAPNLNVNLAGVNP